MSSPYVHSVSVNHIGSTYAERLSRHPVPANHHCETLQAGVKPPSLYTTGCPSVVLRPTIESLSPIVVARSATQMRAD